ncbi:phosphate-starvation-inducible PsiE family protein [Peptostreptococcus equinus]|uniref:Transporter n=1 Tax=Peptostreptococcus equinus TaxID=3003601 RepID=A0ABY7JTM3_9FIRM|nr:phosphate-starvation-inducible PsiE family protein [Peptostreptococcus sp. CBA3647]WAW15330.1 hypothetical protein O0R46_02430 [Peptostreptococcus sp. CBA3647]
MDKKRQRKYILKTAYFFEHLLAVVILLAVILGIFDTLRIIYKNYIVNFNQPVDYALLNSMFAQMLLLVIGVEIAIMLALHLQSAVIEVLLYGIARKILLVPENNGVQEILLGVIAIGGLFVIKKFLVDKNEENETKIT